MMVASVAPGGPADKAGLRVGDRITKVDDAAIDVETLLPAAVLRAPSEVTLEVIRGAKLEPSLAAGTPGARYQFERLGYFCVDTDSTGDAPIFNRTVGLKDSWAKAAAGATS